jgi:hypothetical protein
MTEIAGRSPSSAAIIGGGWALFLHYEPKASPPDPACTYISIRALGWTEGHKTNFCKANGYPEGNFNQDDYGNGGICMRGPEPEICKSSVLGTQGKEIYCKANGSVIACYRH